MDVVYVARGQDARGAFFIYMDVVYVARGQDARSDNPERSDAGVKVLCDMATEGNNGLSLLHNRTAATIVSL